MITETEKRYAINIKSSRKDYPETVYLTENLETSIAKTHIKLEIQCTERWRTPADTVRFLELLAKELREKYLTDK